MYERLHGSCISLSLSLLRFIPVLLLWVTVLHLVLLMVLGPSVFIKVITYNYCVCIELFQITFIFHKLASIISLPVSLFLYSDDTTGNKFWDFVGHLLHEPSKEEKECQAPKPILLDTGNS